MKDSKVSVSSQRSGGTWTQAVVGRSSGIGDL